MAGSIATLVREAEFNERVALALVSRCQLVTQTAPELHCAVLDVLLAASRPPARNGRDQVDARRRRQVVLLHPRPPRVLELRCGVEHRGDKLEQIAAERTDRRARRILRNRATTTPREIVHPELVVELALVVTEVGTCNDDTQEACLDGAAVKLAASVCTWPRSVRRSMHRCSMGAGLAERTAGAALGAWYPVRSVPRSMNQPCHHRSLSGQVRDGAHEPVGKCADTAGGMRAGGAYAASRRSTAQRCAHRIQAARAYDRCRTRS
jgi:hypothetical protein